MQTEVLVKQFRVQKLITTNIIKRKQFIKISCLIINEVLTNIQIIIIIGYTAKESLFKRKHCGMHAINTVIYY